jgi:alanine racemase
MLRDTQIKINLDALNSNLNIIQSMVSNNTTIGAVLKANAYGHGATVIAKTLKEFGLNYFLVATAMEAIQLKRSDPTYQVMIMGHTPDHLLEEAILNEFELTVFSHEQGLLIHHLASKHNVKAIIHLKIDTGFNRLGFAINESLISSIENLYHLDHLTIKGIFTHLALRDQAADEEQFKRFTGLVTQLEEKAISIPFKHICDSIGMALYPHMHMDMVRVGALLYGLQGEERSLSGIQQILTMETRFSHIKTLSEDSYISYGRRAFIKKGSLVGTLPFGYADGYPRALYENGKVRINDEYVNFSGIICMDQCMVDITDLQVDYDTEVAIIDTEKLSIGALSKKAKTNKNEFVSSLAARLPRVYIKEGKPIMVSYEMLGEVHEL